MKGGLYARLFCAIYCFFALYMVQYQSYEKELPNSERGWKIQMSRTDLPRAATPEDVGVYADVVEQFIDYIQKEQLEFHSLMVLRHGKVAAECEFLLFAVKPQSFDDAARSVCDVRVEKVISIMAGIEKNTIKNALGVGLIKVARCMPNLPCSIGSGAMGVDMTDFNANPDDTQFISMLFGCLGTVLSLPESKLDAVTGISGSGPAYVFMFIDALIDAGKKHGLTADEAATLAVQTVLGGAEMVQRGEKPLSEMIMNVCSKGGTTIEAVKVLEENNFRGIVGNAVDACVRRSEELSR